METVMETQALSSCKAVWVLVAPLQYDIADGRPLYIYALLAFSEARC